MTQVQVETTTEELPSESNHSYAPSRSWTRASRLQEAPPGHYQDPVRREQDEYDYDPPGYDPEDDWG